MEIDEILKINDPLYELGMFKVKHRERLLDLLGDRDPRVSRLYKSLVLDTFEMNRLNFLRQSGLAFLVFPSATHTRFSHAIGTWNLGNYALDHIAIESSGAPDQGGKAEWRKLGDWIDGSMRGWREEFFVSLLLHDIGHLPFSHVLEANETLGGFPGHEELGMQLVEGRGRLYDCFERRADELGLTTVAKVLKGFEGVADSQFSFNTHIVLQLLGRDCSEELYPLKELVTGTVDLDRIDHYNRDSYFTGLKLANTNIKGLLENMVLRRKPAFQPCVLEEGEPHLLQLLFSKDLLWRSALDHERVRCYEAMLNEAISWGMCKGALQVEDLVVMGDDDLIRKLEGWENTRTIITRILTRKPYELIWSGVIEAVDGKTIRRGFEEMLVKEGVEEGDLLLQLGVGFGKLPEAWLNLFVMREGRVERIDTRNEDFVQYLRVREKKRMSTVRIYAKDGRVKSRAEGTIRKRMDELGLSRGTYA